MNHESRGFLSPRGALEEEYQRAVEDLRAEVGDLRTLREGRKFWRARRRLRREKVIWPNRSANW